MDIIKEEVLLRVQNWYDKQSPLVVTGFVKNTQFAFSFSGRVRSLEGTVVVLHHDEDTAMTVPLDDASQFEYLDGADVITAKPEEGAEKQFEGGIILHAADDKWSCSIFEVKKVESLPILNDAGAMSGDPIP